MEFMRIIRVIFLAVLSAKQFTFEDEQKSCFSRESVFTNVSQFSFPKTFFFFDDEFWTNFRRDRLNLN